MKAVLFMSFSLGLAALVGEERGVLLENSRVTALVSALKIGLLSDEESPEHGTPIPLDDRLKAVSGFAVKHEIGKQPDGWSDVMRFCDAEGKLVACGEVRSMKSPREAQATMLFRMASNSLPMDMLVASYKVDDHGPGELCIVRSFPDADRRRDVVDDSSIWFVQRNVFVVVRSLDSSRSARGFANAIAAVLDSAR